MSLLESFPSFLNGARLVFSFLSSMCGQLDPLGPGRWLHDCLLCVQGVLALRPGLFSLYSIWA